MRIRNQTLIFAAIGALALMFSCSAQADFARRLSYQGRLTDSNGVPLADGNYDMTFTIYDASAAGTLLWTEAHTGGSQVALANGLFSATLGSISSLNGLSFNGTEYWIEVAVGATTYSPRQRVTAAAMALNIPDGIVTSTKMQDGTALAEIIDDDGSGSGLDCDTLDGYDWSNLPNAQDLWVDEAGNTMSGALNMGNNGITNID